MPFLIALLLVLAVHLAHAVAAWTRIGLLADDRHMVGAAALRHRGDWSFASIWVFDRAPGEAATALYRPFVDLGFWLEQPLHGFTAFGYHVTNSAMHCATALLWFALVRRLSGSIAAGLACALLFVGWPSHSEATHWIAARTNVQSTFLLSAALLVFDFAAADRGRTVRRMLLVCAAAALATAAVGTKESAVFVLPLTVAIAWLRRPAREDGGRPFASLLFALPVVLAVGAWLAWRAHVLGTWSSGTHYGWHAARIGWQSCIDWIELLLAPRHRGYAAPLWSPVQWMLHGALLALAMFALRRRAARGVAAVGALLLAMGYVAGIGLEPMDPATLENARYSYEAVLGLAALGGVALATLPPRALGPALATLVLVHAFVLDANRRSWLQAGAVYGRMAADIVAIARATQQPIRVLQAPGVYEGAFALLNGFTEFRFLQETAPPGTNLRGQVSSTQEWRQVLRELAAAAAAGRAPTNTYVAQWDDGRLAPFELDGRWPLEPVPGVRIGYAWAPRVRPFVDSTMPLHVLVRCPQAIELEAGAEVAGRSWRGATVQVGGAGDDQAIELELPLPADLDAERPVAIELHVRAAGASASIPLGVTVPALRTAH